jgi:membrane protein DedA with SNARE-associated domain
VVTSFLDRLADLPVVAVVALAFAFAWAEAAVGLDLLVPGEVAVVFAGAAVAGDGGALAAVVCFAAAGAVAGDLTSFFAGRYGAARLDRWRWLARRLTRARRRAARFFARHGGGAIAIARWIGALRAVVPFVAGSTGRVSVRRLLAWDVPAALGWAATVAGAGYAFGDDAARTVDDLGWWVSAVVVAAVVATVLVRWAVARRAGRVPAP